MIPSSPTGMYSSPVGSPCATAYASPETSAEDFVGIVTRIWFQE